MLRVFSQKLEHLEKSVQEHDECIKQITQWIGTAGTSKDRIKIAVNEGTLSDDYGSEQSLKFTLDKISASVKETRFSVNDLVSKVSRHEGDIHDLKSAFSRDGQQRCIPGGCNPNASEFHPRSSPRGSISSPRQAFQDTPHTGSSRMSSLFSEDRNVSILASPRSDDGASPDHAALDVDAYKVLDQEYYTGEWDKSPRDYPETDPAALVAEIIYLRRRVEHLNEQLKQKGETTREIILCREQMAAKEKEHTQKQEWYEHKMRLLKQDKRRRGETIGKLLRCIDDMRDNGKIEVSKVTDGRLVLEATLGSRGWPQEQRIKVAVQAMEGERAEQRLLAAGHTSGTGMCGAESRSHAEEKAEKPIIDAVPAIDQSDLLSSVVPISECPMMTSIPAIRTCHATCPTCIANTSPIVKFLPSTIKWAPPPHFDATGPTPVELDQTTENTMSTDCE